MIRDDGMHGNQGVAFSTKNMTDLLPLNRTSISVYTIPFPNSTALSLIPKHRLHRSTQGLSVTVPVWDGPKSHMTK